ncbi:hypothetical protein XENOCAPTIV_007666, partial [Xenoophorus captivus]
LWAVSRKSVGNVGYFGDSMRSDIFPATTFGKWETVMIVEEMEGEGVPKSDAAMSNEAQVEPQEKRGKFEILTWCCHCIHSYSTMAIPSVEHIADLPLDYKFPRFSPDKPCTVGYYPRPPDSVLKMCEDLS